MDDKNMLQLNTRKLIPSIVYFFLIEINKRLEEKKFNKKKDNECTAIILSKDVGYNWDAIKVVQKHYSNDGWECKMTHYYKTEDKKYNIYTWSFERKSNKKKTLIL